jgi:hypothetical protein
MCHTQSPSIRLNQKAPNLDFVHFQRKTGSEKQPIKRGTREQSHIRIRTGGGIDLLIPDEPSHSGQHVMKGGGGFAIPGGLLDADRFAGSELAADESDQAVCAQQQRCTALNGKTRPLPLGLEAQMSTSFLKGTRPRDLPPIW